MDWLLPINIGVAQDVGAPFQDELNAADAADKDSLAQHLQLIDEVPSPPARGYSSQLVCLARDSSVRA